MADRRRRWTHEPLLHFLVLGALLFLVFSLFGPRGGSGRVVVTPALVEHLADTFAMTWQRRPTEEELVALVDDHVKEEILYREAIALGLDDDDVVIRRRLRQKMEFLSEDVAIMAEPSEDDLARYLAAHPDDFRVESLTSFRHIFLSDERRGAASDAEASRLLDDLRSGAIDEAEATRGADPFLLAASFEAVSEKAIAAQLGDGFAAALVGVPVGVWSGPIESAYGKHIVLVTERTEGRVPPLAEVRDAVEREWRSAERRKANEAFYAKLRERYDVTVEIPPTAAAGASSSLPR